MSGAIEVGKDGPYAVTGVKVVRERVINDDTGHAHHSETYDQVHDGTETTWLCRCGHSENKPFCDGSHRRADFDGNKTFDGTETAPTDGYDERAEVLGGTGVQVRDDRALCSHVGYCTTKGDNVWKQVGNSADDAVRQELIERVERCPSGALTHRRDPEATDDEPALPQQVAVQADGPLVVTGGVAITRADGETFETRNRVTLCRCGHSKTKPLCDGCHAEAGFAES